MTNKYQKYKEIVNKPQELLRQGFNTLKDWSPDNNWLQLVRVPSATVAFNLYLAVWLFTRIGLENPLIERIDNKNENKQIKKSPKTSFGRFINAIKQKKKNSPTASAFISYYFLLLSLIGVGKVTYDNKDSIKQIYIELKHKDDIKIDDIKIDPTLPQAEWEKQMDAIWPYLYMETILSEGFINEAYADVGDTGGYLTIGSGYMIGKANPKTDNDRAIIKERKDFFKKALGKPYVNGVSISYDENRILVRRFYEKYVWPQIKKDFTVPMDVHLFIELCIGSYNRGNGVYKNGGKHIKNAVNSGESIQNIVNRFDDFHTAGNDGLLPKYGIAAHRALGHIPDSVVLNSSANSVYQFSARDMWKDGVLIPYDSIAKDLQSFTGLVVKKNGKTYNQQKVREYMYPYEREYIANGFLFDPSVIVFNQIQDKQETTAEQLNEQAEKLCDAGEYRAALDKFNEALAQDPGMHIVYSNLSLVYYKLGEYENGIKVVRDFINSKYFKNAPATVKGYSYYNAALCYEKLGDNTNDAMQKKFYYERAKKNSELGEKIANTKYYVFNKRIDKKLSELTQQKTKTTAFNDGIIKIKNKQNEKNIAVYQTGSVYRT